VWNRICRRDCGSPKVGRIRERFLDSLQTEEVFALAIVQNGLDVVAFPLKTGRFFLASGRVFCSIGL
jgi:hypothetical protein